jgi:hypothetical protein
MTRAEALAAFDRLLLIAVGDYDIKASDAVTLRTAAIDFAHAAAIETLTECQASIHIAFKDEIHHK